MKYCEIEANLLSRMWFNVSVKAISLLLLDEYPYLILLLNDLVQQEYLGFGKGMIEDG